MDEYIELSIEIFDHPRQSAQVLRSLTIGSLIDEILREFDDLDKSRIDSYAVFLRGKDTPLDPRRTLAQLDLQAHDELIFRYARPTGRLVMPAQDRAFFQEQVSNAIFEIRFNPALIGRASNDPAHNAQLGVNLKFHPDSGYVSRRHAQVVMAGGQYFIEALSENSPTFVNTTGAPVTGRCPLQSGDHVYLSKARITLVFFHLLAGTFDASLPLATVHVEFAGQGETILPITRAPLTLGREGCDINVPDLPRSAEIRFNSASGKYELVVENRPVVELPHSYAIDISPTAHLHFQMA